MDSAAGLMALGTSPQTRSASSRAANINQRYSIAIGWLPIIPIQIFRWNQFSAAKLVHGQRYRRHLIKQPGAAPQDLSGRPASAESAAEPIADETRFQR